MTDTEPHQTTVVVDNTKRYPYIPACTCSKPFRGFLKHESAQLVADDHAANPTSP